DRRQAARRRKIAGTEIGSANRPPRPPRSSIGKHGRAVRSRRTGMDENAAGKRKEEIPGARRTEDSRANPRIAGSQRARGDGLRPPQATRADGAALSGPHDPLRRPDQTSDANVAVEAG